MGLISGLLLKRPASNKEKYGYIFVYYKFDQFTVTVHAIDRPYLYLYVYNHIENALQIILQRQLGGIIKLRIRSVQDNCNQYHLVIVEIRLNLLHT